MKLGHTQKWRTQEDYKGNLRVNRESPALFPLNKNVNLFDKTQQDIEKDKKKTDQINQ